VHSRNCLGLESHLIGKVAATLSVTNMVVSFKEAGLGNEDITLVYVNPGGQCPNAANKKTVTTERTAEATFRPKNCQVTASLMLIPPPTPDLCSSRQTEQLAEISYTNKQITDLTNNVSKTAMPTTTAAAPFTCL
jgi:hypothetical protein